MPSRIFEVDLIRRRRARHHHHHHRRLQAMLRLLLPRKSFSEFRYFLCIFRISFEIHSKISTLNDRGGNPPNFDRSGRNSAGICSNGSTACPKFYKLRLLYFQIGFQSWCVLSAIFTVVSNPFVQSNTLFAIVSKFLYYFENFTSYLLCTCFDFLEIFAKNFESLFR